MHMHEVVHDEANRMIIFQLASSLTSSSLAMHMHEVVHDEAKIELKFTIMSKYSLLILNGIVQNTPINY